MAYDPNQQDPNAQNQAAQPNAMMTSSAPGSGPGSSAGKSSAPQATPAQPFQNLQAYLGANAPQVDQQANKIAGNLTNQYGQIQSDIGKAGTEFGNQVKGGYTAANPDIENQAISNPTDFVKNPDNVKAFQSLYNDSYTGPSDFESSTPYGQLSQQVSSAASNAKNFNSLPGMQTYFQGQNPNATQGGNTLDSVLLSGNPGAYSKIQQAAKPFGTLNDYLNTTTNTADKGVASAQKEAGDISSALRNQFTGEGGVIPTFQKNVNDKYNQFLNTSSNELANIKNDLAAGGLTAKEIKELGLTPEQASKFMNSYSKNIKASNLQFDPTSYLQNNINGITPENFASKEDYQKALALNQLTGSDMGFLNSGNASKAGTAGNPYGLNLSKASTDLADLLSNNVTPPTTPTQPTSTNGGNDINRAITDIGNNFQNNTTNQIKTDPKAILGDILAPGNILEGPIENQVHNLPTNTSALLGDLINPTNITGNPIGKVIDSVGNRSTDNLNPFSGGEKSNTNAGIDAGKVVGNVANTFNKYLPAQYQIDPGQGKDILSIIPPQGAIPDMLRNTMIQNILGGLAPGVENGAGAKQLADAGLTPDVIASAYRSNQSALTPTQKSFLQKYDAANPQKVQTRQDTLDAMAKADKGTVSAGGGSKYKGVF